MLKLTSLAIGLLTAISIVPAAQAFPVGNDPYQHHRDNQSPVVVSVNAPIHRGTEYRPGWEADRRRQLELVREREARARWEAAHSRHHQYGRDRYRSNDYHRDNRDSYDNRYRANDYRGNR
jgi:hypothetical protein